MQFSSCLWFGGGEEDSQSSFNLWIYSFPQVWKIFSHYIFKYFFYPSSLFSLEHSNYVVYEVISWKLKLSFGSLIIFFIFLRFFSLVVFRDSFYCYVFKFTGLFFCQCISSSVFFILHIVVQYESFFFLIFHVSNFQTRGIQLK